MDTMAFYGTLHKYFYGHHTIFLWDTTQNIFMVIDKLYFMDIDKLYFMDISQIYFMQF